MKKYFAIFVLFAFLANCAQAKRAVCKFEVETVRGELVLTQANASAPLHIEGKLTNITDEGLHGFHIHENKSVGNACKDAGRHFNPTGKLHGDRTSNERHVGDLGNVQVASGSVSISMEDKVASMFGTEDMNILGRAIVFHSKPDDLTTSGDGFGNAGTRIGCCLIKETSSATNVRTSITTLVSMFVMIFPAMKIFA